MFICLAIIFLVIFHFYCTKHSRTQDQALDSFWERERKANATRRQNIEELDFVVLPTELIPATLHTPEETKLLALTKEKMIDLTEYTNTDLKLKFGPANLETLSSYEQNYISLLHLIPVYARQLHDAGQLEEGKALLEYGMELENNSASIYNTFKELYQSQEAEI